MSMKHQYDVVVIGGGPGGMMAALRAAERGLSVLLLEKNSVLGKKLSITGGGRCNITHAEFDTRALLKNYGNAEPFLHSAFSQFDVQSTFDFFTAQGLPLVIEDKKRAFPKTMKAEDVTSTLERCVRQSGVTVLTDSPVSHFITKDGVLSGVATNTGIYTGRAYIIASGGKSHPETGSTGDGVTWLQKIGHTIHTPNPDLVPLVIEDSWVRELSGSTLGNVKVTFMNESKRINVSGDILCTHFGFSGPRIINTARQVKEMLALGRVVGWIDLFPAQDIGSLRKSFHDVCVDHTNKAFKNAVSEFVSPHLASAVLQGFSEEIQNTKTHSVIREDRHRLVEKVKHMTFTVCGTKGYEWAIVSDGGVDLTEIDTRTMQSKICPSVYVVGDMLNVNRQSGGFSLQLCWTTGFVAGDNVLR
jgi:predicted Rossmann fold flavoprotein